MNKVTKGRLGSENGASMSDFVASTVAHTHKPCFCSGIPWRPQNSTSLTLLKNRPFLAIFFFSLKYTGSACWPLLMYHGFVKMYKEVVKNMYKGVVKLYKGAVKNMYKGLWSRCIMGLRKRCIKGLQDVRRGCQASYWSLKRQLQATKMSEQCVKTPNKAHYVDSKAI